MTATDGLTRAVTLLLQLFLITQPHFLDSASFVHTLHCAAGTQYLTSQAQITKQLSEAGLQALV